MLNYVKKSIELEAKKHHHPKKIEESNTQGHATLGLRKLNQLVGGSRERA